MWFAKHVVPQEEGREFVGSAPSTTDKSPVDDVHDGQASTTVSPVAPVATQSQFLIGTHSAQLHEVVLERPAKYQLPVETVLMGPSKERLRRQLSHRRGPAACPPPWPPGWFPQPACAAPPGAPALAYLKDQRGLSESTLESFEIGYAPDPGRPARPSHPRLERPLARAARTDGLVVSRKGAKRLRPLRIGDGAVLPRPPGRVIGSGGAASMAVNPNTSTPPETDGVPRRASTSSGPGSRHLRHPQGRTRRWWWRATVDVIALHAAGPHQMRWPRSHGPEQPAEFTQLCAAAKAAGSCSIFDTDAPAVRAPSGDRRGGAAALQRASSKLRVLATARRKDPDDFLKEPRRR